MTVTMHTLGIDKLGVDARLALVEEIWASICADPQRFPFTSVQRAELERRAGDDDRSPEDIVSWENVKRSVRRRLGK